ncbi:MAG: zinc dependent phospholipase C family protein [Eubacteriales bacterium]
MPSLYTHQVIAEKVFKKMNKPNYIKEHYDEFLLGSIGVEMFNYHKLLKIFKFSHLEQTGYQLKYANHKDFILTLIEYSKGDVRRMVYVLGIMTNYAADRTIRPYIHSATEKPEGGGDTAKQIEFEQALDAYIYRENELEDIVAQADFLAKVKRKDVRHVSGLLSSVCRYVSDGKRVWRKDVVAAYDDMVKFTLKIKRDEKEAMQKMRLYEAMIGKVGRLTIYVPPNIIQGNDIFNLAHRTWRAPHQPQKARTESIVDLIEKSVDLSVDIINQVNEYYIDECTIEKVEKAIGNINFNGREMN